MGSLLLGTCLEVGVGSHPPRLPHSRPRGHSRARPPVVANSQRGPTTTALPPSPPGYRHQSCFSHTIKGVYLRFIAGLCPQGVTSASLWTLCGP